MSIDLTLDRMTKYLAIEDNNTEEKHAQWLLLTPSERSFITAIINLTDYKIAVNFGRHYNEYHPRYTYRNRGR